MSKTLRQLTGGEFSMESVAVLYDNVDALREENTVIALLRGEPVKFDWAEAMEFRTWYHRQLANSKAQCPVGSRPLCPSLITSRA